MRLFVYLIPLFFAACQSCSQGNSANEKVQSVDNESLIQANRQRMFEEAIRIEKFIERKGWQMKTTGTGLRYHIYESRSLENPLAQNKQIAWVNTKVYLLNGDLVYRTEDGKPQAFRIGRDDVESGLHEGILLMRVGDKARFVLPSHLAHGLVGDDVAIPGGASILYEVELVDLKEE